VDRSGAVSYAELCSRMRLLDLKPAIHITQSDFDVITQVCEGCTKPPYRRGTHGPGLLVPILCPSVLWMQTR
jgi:hypothetical protein